MKRTTLIVVVLASVAANCQRDDGISTDRIQQVAVTAGDFDDIAAPFKRNDIAHDVFEGLISTATWDEDFIPGNVALKVEDLFIAADGAGRMNRFQAVFVASGTRGFGARQYNGLDADDELVQDERVQDNVERYVSRGNKLLVTDWAYELVDTIWPDAIDFLGPDPSQSGGVWVDLDQAQRGVITDVVGEIVDPELREALGMDTIALDYPYSNFVVVEDVGPDTTVYIRGDVSYRPDLTADPVTIEDVPLLMGFEHEGGTVVYSTFAVDAQHPAVMDDLIEALFGKFESSEDTVAVE